MEANNKDGQNGIVDRRKFIAKTVLASAGIAITALPGDGDAQATRQGKKPAAANKPGIRKLGRLEVSSVGLGVQNMSRTYRLCPKSRSCTKS